MKAKLLGVVLVLTVGVLAGLKLEKPWRKPLVQKSDSAFTDFLPDPFFLLAPWFLKFW